MGRQRPGFLWVRGWQGDPGLSQDRSCPGVCMPAVGMHLLVQPWVQVLTEKAGVHPGPVQ